MNAETSPSLASLGNDIQGLHNLSQFLRHSRIHPTEQYDASHPPEELVDKTTPTDEICSSGPLLLEGLRSPDINERRAALAQLNKIEQLRQAIPELEYDLGTVGHHIEVSGFDSIRHIIRTDKELFIPALGFLYQRAAAKSYESSWELCQHLPALFGPANDKSEAAPRAQLQYDIVRTMAENPHGTLLTSFIDSLGLGMYGFSPAVWEEVGEQPDRRIWAQKNIETMLALERIEPGLCAKLYQQFRTKNFARCKPETWRGMYKARLENPQQPYVMDLVASHDYNFANSHPQNYDTLFKKLQTADVGYELYECTDATDIQHAQNQATIRLNDHAAHIKNLIIRGHANPLGIQLSKSRWIRASNIDYMSQLEGVLDDDATIF